MLMVNTFSNRLKVLVNLQVFHVNLSQSSTKQHELCELSAFSPLKSVQGNYLLLHMGPESHFLLNYRGIYNLLPWGGTVTVIAALTT